jgi:hypothetical protein
LEAYWSVFLSFRTTNTDFFEDERWVEWLDSKIALLINREGVEPRDYGGKNYDEYVVLRSYCLDQRLNDLRSELTKAVEPYLKQEDEGKFRCKTCQKLFKATSFVEKHIANKHPELVKSLDEVISEVAQRSGAITDDLRPDTLL